MNISFCNSNDKHYQGLLNVLMKQTFLDFQFWYDLNLWDANYESYSIIQDDKLVSNICVFKTNIVFSGKHFNALSVGAVATKAEYRKKGYSRLIMQHIIDKYSNVPMYLSANETVVDFYPKFGFKRIYEKLPVAKYVINNDIEPVKFDINDKLCEYVYKKVNFSPVLDCLNTAAVNLFHIHWGYLKDCIYDIQALDTVVIAEQNKNKLKIKGVFSLRDVCFTDLLMNLPFKGVDIIEFGFMPYWNDCKYEMTSYEHDPIFVRNVGCDLGDFKFPELSIT